jgi:hypothetical protein
MRGIDPQQSSEGIDIPPGGVIFTAGTFVDVTRAASVCVDWRRLKGGGRSCENYGCVAPIVGRSGQNLTATSYWAAAAGTRDVGLSGTLFSVKSCCDTDDVCDEWSAPPRALWAVMNGLGSDVVGKYGCRLYNSLILAALSCGIACYRIGRALLSGISCKLDGSD